MYRHLKTWTRAFSSVTRPRLNQSSTTNSSQLPVTKSPSLTGLSLSPPPSHPHPDRLSIAIPDLKENPQYQPAAPAFLLKWFPYCFENDPKPGYEEHGHAMGVLGAVGLLFGWVLMGGLLVAHGYERVSVILEKRKALTENQEGLSADDERKAHALYVLDEWIKYLQNPATPQLANSDASAANEPVEGQVVVKENLHSDAITQ